MAKKKKDPKDVETDPIAPTYPVDTSVEAAIEISKTDRVAQRRAINKYICQCYGPTRKDAKIALGIAHQSLTARVWELLGSNGRYKPVIYESGYKTYPGSTRKHRRLWPVNDD